MEHVGTDLGPGAVGVLGHERCHDEPRLGVEADAGLYPRALAFFFIDGCEIRVQSLGHHPQTKARGSPRGHPSIAAHQHSGSSRAAGLGCDVHGATPIFEGFPGPGIAHRFEGFVHALAPSLERAVELGELLLQITDAGRIRHASTANQVEYGHVFCQAQGVVKRNDEGADLDFNALRARRHRAGENQRRRQVTVLGGVVFGEHDLKTVVLLPPDRHLEGRAIEFPAARRTEGRGSHVEPHQEHVSSPFWIRLARTEFGPELGSERFAPGRAYRACPTDASARSNTSDRGRTGGFGRLHPTPATA